MRMVNYFAVVAAFVVPALLATMWTGMTGADSHLSIGLLAAIFTVALHTVLIVFMIITGRVLREAVRARNLKGEFLSELNEFFSSKKVYPVSVFAAFGIVAAAVLGYGNRAFDLPPAVHMLVGLSAMIFTLWAIPLEVRTLLDNQRLLDRAAAELDRIDREEGPAMTEEEFAEAEAYDPRRMSHWTINLAIGAWLPYLYWVFIVCRGDFSRASIHPFLEVSAIAFVLWLLARRDQKRSAA